MLGGLLYHAVTETITVALWVTGGVSLLSLGVWLGRKNP